jgi:hypothetical protein
MTHKRDIQVSVRMSVEDLDLLKQAADTLWPKAILTNSSIVLGLARIGAEKALERTQPKKRS